MNFSFTAALATGALLLGIGAGCSSNSEYLRENHWRRTSVTPRVVYNLTGYRPDDHGSFRNFQAEEKRSINLTLRRHLLNSNPENPFQPADYSYVGEREPVSLLPDPFNYFHLSSVVVGGLISASSSSHAFIPIPIDSIIATIEPGGLKEFRDGLFGAHPKPTSRHTRHVPPPVEAFKLRHQDAPVYIEQ